MEQKFFTVEQVAQLIGMHPKTIRRYIHEQKLQATKVGKSYLISAHALNRFTEGDLEPLPDSTKGRLNQKKLVRGSTVVDVEPISSEQAMRIENTLVAALNSKPIEADPCSMHCQYDSQNLLLRVYLNGNADTIASLLRALSTLTNENQYE
jgi:excisionase family DNA binding protein